LRDPIVPAARLIDFLLFFEDDESKETSRPRKAEKNTLLYVLFAWLKRFRSWVMVKFWQLTQTEQLWFCKVVDSELSSESEGAERTRKTAKMVKCCCAYKAARQGLLVVTILTFIFSIVFVGVGSVSVSYGEVVVRLFL
jgi:hypothetical protein